MYVSPNFKTKKALKEALAKGERIEVFQPNDMFGKGTPNGRVTLEGPHTWYADGECVNGILIKVK